MKEKCTVIISRKGIISFTYITGGAFHLNNIHAVKIAMESKVRNFN